MPVLVEEPALLSKSRLRSDFVTHNVKLHLKHIDQRKAAEFSSDEEEDVQDEAEEEENPEEAEMPDPSALTDDDLKAALLRLGFKPGPIVATTRALYQKKLSRLLRSNGHNLLKGAEKVMYSASEEEEEEENGEDDDAESGAEEEKQEVAEQSDEVQPGSIQPPREPVIDTFKDLLPAETTPTGIYATRRRPIKGAAGRPVQYAYPDTPFSPTTLERREVERRLVPIHIRLLFFVVMVCILYLVYAVLCQDTTHTSTF